MSAASRWLACSARLALAMAWRIRREGLRYMSGAFLPFAGVLALITVLALVRGDRLVNGAGAAAVFGVSQGARANAVAVGFALTLGPALVALFSAIGVARMIQGLVGADVSRGTLEALLSAPYTAGNIAGALLADVVLVTIGFWALMSALAALDVAIVAGRSGDHLSLTAGYLALALVLPLLSALAGGVLTLLGSMLFPGVTQLGATVSVAGGNLNGGLAVLPGVGAVLAMVLGAEQLGPVHLLLFAGGGVALIVVAALGLIAWKFRPETVLGS